MQIRKPKKTPAQIVGSIIECAMIVQGETRRTIADKMCISQNTVCSDLKDPDKIPQNRLWMYFTVLDIPVQDALQPLANKFAQKLTER